MVAPTPNIDSKVEEMDVLFCVLQELHREESFNVAVSSCNAVSEYVLQFLHRIKLTFSLSRQNQSRNIYG